MVKRKSRRRCQGVCGERMEGSTKDRSGREDGIPLGKIKKCQHCGRWACPDCLHERDCCDAEDMALEEKMAMENSV